MAWPRNPPHWRPLYRLPCRTFGHGQFPGLTCTSRESGKLLRTAVRFPVPPIDINIGAESSGSVQADRDQAKKEITHALYDVHQT